MRTLRSPHLAADPSPWPLPRRLFTASPTLALGPLQLVRVHVCVALPDELEAVKVKEAADRGSVELGGQSAIFEVEAGQPLCVSIGDGELLNEQQRQLWTGEATDFEFEVRSRRAFHSAQTPHTPTRPLSRLRDCMLVALDCT